jgi:hypothetical protein
MPRIISGIPLIHGRRQAGVSAIVVEHAGVVEEKLRTSFQWAGRAEGAGWSVDSTAGFLLPSV